MGVRVDHEARLHLLVNGVDQGVAAKEIPPTVYVVLDLYGQCQEVLYSPSCMLQGSSHVVHLVTFLVLSRHVESMEISYLYHLPVQSTLLTYTLLWRLNFCKYYVHHDLLNMNMCVCMYLVVFA